MAIDEADPETHIIHEGRASDKDWQKLRETGGTLRMVFTGSRKGFEKFLKALEEKLGSPIVELKGGD